jgi:hypothetical protein
MFCDMVNFNLLIIIFILSITKITSQPLKVFSVRRATCLTGQMLCYNWSQRYYNKHVLLYGFSKFFILIGWQAVRKNPYPDRGPYFPYWFLNFQLCFTDKNFKQPNCFWLSMHAYRILLPSETDDSRFNSREKHNYAHRLSSAI